MYADSSSTLYIMYGVVALQQFFIGGCKALADTNWPMDDVGLLTNDARLFAAPLL